MKKILIFIAMTGVFFTLSSQAANAETARQQLILRMQKILEKGYMFGHQDDPFYGITWQWEYGRSDVLEACGDYPAVMGFDLGGIEMGDKKNLDSVPFTRIREELLAHVKRGGIVTISWHPRNPMTGGTAWDNSDSSVVRNILPGGNIHKKFLLWMKSVRNFLMTLKDENGKLVPVIFRPWHEYNGSWFWWGEKLCSPQEYKALWCMLQDYLLAEGLDNLVWGFSPNLDGNCPESKFLLRYPGDERVDIIGLDAYQWGNEEDYIKQINADLSMLSNYAQKHNKLLALTECGIKNIPDPSWWTRILKPQMDKYVLSYFLVWRNTRHEFFGPAPGEKNSLYFNEMIRNGNILMLKDIVK